MSFLTHPDATLRPDWYETNKQDEENDRDNEFLHPPSIHEVSEEFGINPYPVASMAQIAAKKRTTAAPATMRYVRFTTFEVTKL